MQCFCNLEHHDVQQALLLFIIALKTQFGNICNRVISNAALGSERIDNKKGDV